MDTHKQILDYASCRLNLLLNKLMEQDTSDSNDAADLIARHTVLVFQGGFAIGWPDYADYSRFPSDVYLEIFRRASDYQMLIFSNLQSLPDGFSHTCLYEQRYVSSTGVAVGLNKIGEALHLESAEQVDDE